MDLREELKSADVYPTGPVSAWPLGRHEELSKMPWPRALKLAEPKMPSAGKMAKGLLKTAGQAIRRGRVSKEIRDERYSTCQACPFFNADSKRCSECGCFMEAKTWVGGDPDTLCPKKRWKR